MSSEKRPPSLAQAEKKWDFQEVIGGYMEEIRRRESMPTSLWKRGVHSSIQLLCHSLYPPLCLHCREKLSCQPPLFCTSCLTQLSLIPLEGRCRFCFCEQEQGVCLSCRHCSELCYRQLAAIEPLGAGQSLLRALLQGREETLSAAAALMAYQWLKQKLPPPDALIPLPLSLWQRYHLGFDVNAALARNIGSLFSVPVYSVLKRVWDRTVWQETGVFKAHYQVRTKESLADKRLLLIAPQLGTAIQSAAGALEEHFPKALYGLALAL